MEKFEDVIFDLFPADKKNFVTQRQAVNLCKDEGIPTSLRTFQLYLEKGIIRRGFREGKEVYFSKDYIHKELPAIHILKTTFKRSIEDIVKLANYKSAYLYKIVEELRRILLYIFESDASPKKTGRLFMEIVNDKKYQMVIDAYFDRILNGQDYRIVNVKEFVIKSLEKK